MLCSSPDKYRMFQLSLCLTNCQCITLLSCHMECRRFCLQGGATKVPRENRNCKLRYSSIGSTLRLSYSIHWKNYLHHLLLTVIFFRYFHHLVRKCSPPTRSLEPKHSKLIRTSKFSERNQNNFSKIIINLQEFFPTYASVLSDVRKEIYLDRIRSCSVYLIMSYYYSIPIIPW